MLVISRFVAEFSLVILQVVEFQTADVSLVWVFLEKHLLYILALLEVITEFTGMSILKGLGVLL